MTRAAERYRERAEPLALRDQDPASGGFDPRGRHSNDAGHVLHTLDTFGTASSEFAQQGIGRIAAVMRSRGEALPDDVPLNAGLAAVTGIAPENETEAMLAIQMVGTHEVAMEMLTRAKLADTTDKLDRYGTLATKLLRTFTAQTEALAKLRRGGSQEVVVKHVHVYQGGQAIVGNVTTAGPGGGGAHLDEGRQPHAPDTPLAKSALPAPIGAAVLCSDTLGLPVSGPGGERPEAVPDARRSRGKRSTRG